MIESERKKLNEAGEDIMVQAFKTAFALSDDSDEYAAIAFGMMGAIMCTVGGLTAQTVVSGSEKNARDLFFEAAGIAYDDGFKQGKEIE